MSEENKNLQQEEKLVLSADDIKNTQDYFEHFKIPITDDLIAACEAFKKEQTLANQKAFKLALCQCIRTSKHESFTDKMFNEVKKTAAKAEYNLQFDKDLYKEIGRNED
jgi:hypothetical protein